MTDSEGSVHKKPWVHDSILETQRNEYEVKIAALEAENKRLREEVKFCKSCFNANPCGAAIKEQDRDELLRRYRKTLVGWLNELRQENHRYREALEKIKADTHNRPGREPWDYYCNRLHKILMIAMEALGGQDADK